MPISIHRLELMPPSDLSCTADAIHAVRLKMYLKLEGDDRGATFQQVYKSYPALFSHLTWDDASDTGLMIYVGKGSVRAILRSLVNAFSGQEPHIHVSPALMEEARQLLAHTSLLSHATVASSTTHVLTQGYTSRRPRYTPDKGSILTGSINQVKRQTVVDSDTNIEKTYVISSHPGARRSLGDIVASIAKLLHYLSEGRTPSTTVFQDQDGYRCAFGSDFKADAVTLLAHCASLSGEARALFLKAHAKDIGECMAFLTYADQEDFHCDNLMYDGRFFIIDFDKCYNTRTRKYALKLPVQNPGDFTADFTQVSQRDLRSPLNPIDRYTTNWFLLQQPFYSFNTRLHTLEKLQMLPGLDELMTDEQFLQGYFTGLYACARLDASQIGACTSQIANAQLRAAMVQDFSARSAQLRQQLFSMPEFIDYYQTHAASLEMHLQGLTCDDFHMPASWTLTQFEEASTHAIQAKIIELDAAINDLQKQLLNVSDQHKRMRIHRRAELEILGIHKLIEWLANKTSESDERVLQLKIYKDRIIHMLNQDILTQPAKHDSANSATEDGLLAIPELVAARNNLKAFIDSDKDGLQALTTKLTESLSIDEKLQLFSNDTTRRCVNWQTIISQLILLEMRQDAYFIAMMSDLTKISADYIVWMQKLLGEMHQYQVSMSADQLRAMSAVARQAYFAKQISQLEQLLSDIKHMSTRGLLCWLDTDQICRQFDAEIDTIKQQEVEIQCRQGEIPAVTRCIMAIREPATEPEQSFTIITMLNQYLQALPQGTRKAQQSSKTLLAIYAQELQCDFENNCLELANNVMDRIVSQPTVIPKLPVSHEVESVKAYCQKYNDSKHKVYLYLRWIEQLETLHQMLINFSSRESVIRESMEKLALLKQISQTNKATFEKNKERGEKNIDEFHRIYHDTKTATWRKANASSKKRPDGMEEQQQIYVKARGSVHYDAWLTWVEIHATGRRAAKEPGLMSQVSAIFGVMLRAPDTQAYYDSFAEDVRAIWPLPLISLEHGQCDTDDEIDSADTSGRFGASSSGSH